MTEKLSIPPKKVSDRFDDWVYRLWKIVVNGEAVTGSSTSQSDHTLLSNLNSTRYSHLTSEQLAELVSGGQTALHSHSNSSIDHTSLANLNSANYYHMSASEYAGTGYGVFVKQTTPTINGQIADYIDFSQTSAATLQPSRLQWNSSDGTLDLGMGYDGVTQQIGLEQYYRVKNQTGAGLVNGYVAMATGTVGNSGIIKAAHGIANGSVLARYMLGVLTMDIANGDDGYVTAFGQVRGIDTTGSVYGEVWDDGDVLYVSPTTAGFLTKTEPQAPYQKVVMAIVIKAHNSGTLFVRPDNGMLLRDLHNVSNATPNGNDTIIYDSAVGVWNYGSYTHNILGDLQGGTDTGVFESTAFEVTAFQQGIVEYYHTSKDQYEALVAEQSILNTSIDASLDDTAYTVLVNVSDKTMTLPEATLARYGREWTIVQNCYGYVDITPDGVDEIILSGGSDTIRLTQKGSNVTLRCVSTTQWVIA